MKKFFCVVLVTCVSWLTTGREEMPDHDITLFDLKVTASGVTISNPRSVANKVGYDNQPKFIDNDSLYFTSMDDINADIWLWQSVGNKGSAESKMSTDKASKKASNNRTSNKNGTIKQLTKTLESEYSPTPIPFKNSAFSAIRVEHDNTQRLWQVNPDGSFELLFRDIKPVGYHVWQAQNVAMFILGEPNRLEAATYGKEGTKVLDKSIGRCLANVPQSEKISYTVEAQGRHQLKLYDFSDQSFQSLMNLPGESQDYAWFDEDKIMSSDGTQLLWSDINEQKWLPVTVAEEHTFKGLSRIAISPDGKKMALVHLK